MKVWLLEIWHVFDFFGSFISRFISGCAATLGIVMLRKLYPVSLQFQSSYDGHKYIRLIALSMFDKN